MEKCSKIKRMVKTKMTKEKIHNELRNILIKYECEEFGDAIIDEICELFNYPKTD